jgi:hypothetical protein
MAPMYVLLLSVLAQPAQAKPLGWLQRSATSVELPGTVNLPLLRGPSTAYLPAVAGAVRIEGHDAPRPLLVGIDLTSGWSRIDADTLSTLGVEPEWSQLRGRWMRVAELPALQLGDLVLEGVHLEVTDEAAGLELGFAALPRLGAALLPSEGVVRVVPASGAEALVRSLGEPARATVEPTDVYVVDGTEHRGDGVTLAIPASVVLPGGLAEGRIALATRAQHSQVASRGARPDTHVGGEPAFGGLSARMGSVETVPFVAVSADLLPSPDPELLGVLGHDVLFSFDLAVAPAAGLVSVRRAATVQSHDAEQVALAAARERFAQDEALRPTEERAEGRVQIGFDGPKAAAVPLGDPGDPVLRERHLDLAEALWSAGVLDEALRHYLAASEHAGDHCLTHLRLGQRRLAWSGLRQRQGFVQDLTEQPLRRAGTLWSQWLQLDQATRDAIWAGTELPEGSLQVFQPEECMLAWGLLAAAATEQGRREAALDLEKTHADRSLSVAFARAQRLLAEGQPLTAEGVLAFVVEHDNPFPLDARLAWAQALAGRSAGEAMRERIREVPHYPTDHPLSAALAVLEAGRQAGDAKAATRALLQGDPTWAWGQVVDALARGEAPPTWQGGLEQRWPGSPQVAALRAVHLTLSGEAEAGAKHLAEHKAPAQADYWAARAVLAHLEGDEEGRDEALEQWKLRFPMLPGMTLGLTEPK